MAEICSDAPHLHVSVLLIVVSNVFHRTAHGSNFHILSSISNMEKSVTSSSRRLFYNRVVESMRRFLKNARPIRRSLQVKSSSGIRNVSLGNAIFPKEKFRTVLRLVQKRNNLKRSAFCHSLSSTVDE